MAGPIFIITGAPGSGKSTVADELLRTFPHGYHIDVDGLREMVVSGLASPLEWNDETSRQFALAFESAALLAGKYSDAGFAVAIEASMDPSYVQSDFVEPLGSYRVHLIYLAPSLEVVLERNSHRQNKSFDTSVLEPVIREMHAEASHADWTGWRVIDTSDQSAADTVSAILSVAE